MNDNAENRAQKCGSLSRNTIPLVAYAFIVVVLIGCCLEGISREPATLGQTIQVPLDYKARNLGTGSLYFEFGAPYDRAKPTIFIIADAQQFYVRRGEVASLQRSIFGDTFNVIGIVGRGSLQQFVHAALDAKGQPDWQRAWQIFNSDQWIDDIETVRRKVVGRSGKILLYGRSGGAYLVHQYLTKYGMHVLRAFTQAALNPFIVNELGLNSDHFWEEIGAQNPDLQSMLRGVLERRPDERETIIMTLQRQNFFVPPEQLATARAALIRALAEGDAPQYEEARRQYQVDAIRKLNSSPEGIPTRVRLYEFFYPLGVRQRLGGEAIYPDLENQYNIAKPLVMLADAGKIPPLSFNFAALHRRQTEVFIVAGRWDHTADYRSSIALAANYPHHQLFIANDNHTFTNLNKSGDTNRILRAFFESGLSSPKLKLALNTAEPLRWRE